MIKRSQKIALTLIGAIVLLEGIFVLKVLGLGDLPLTHFDYRQYNQLALNVLDHGVFSESEVAPFHPTTYRSPGYPAFIALIYSIVGRSTMAIGAAQFGLLAVTSVLIYHLSRKFFSEIESLTAGVLTATYPPLVFFAPLYVAELVSTTLVVASIVLIVRGQKVQAYFVSGLLLAGATLARPSFLLLGVFLLPFVMRMRLYRRALLAAGAFSLGFLLLLLPWIVRNRGVAGQLINLQTSAGWTLYVSAQQYGGEISYRMFKPEWDIIVAEFIQRTALAEQSVASVDSRALRGISPVVAMEVARDKRYSSDAIEKMRLLPPTQYIKSLPSRIFWLWSTSDVSPWQIGLFHRFQQALYSILVVFAAIGAWFLRKRLWELWPFWIVPVYLTVLHLVFHVEARYTLPGRPFLFAFCGVGLCAFLRFRKA